jgi:hypothetical protein
MKRIFAIGASAVVGVVLSACQASVGSNVSVPHDAAATCGGQCAEVGLALDSVVIMANNVGCVCRPRGAPASSSNAGATGGAGGVVAVMLQQQQQQQQQSYRRR